MTTGVSRTFSRVSLLLVASTLTLIAATSAMASSPVDPVLERLAGAGMLEAAFTQTDHWALTLMDEESSGMVYLGPPNLFRLLYTDPPGRSLGYDGSDLYTIEPEARQVLIHRTGEPESFLALLEEARDPEVVTMTQQSGDSVVTVLEGDFGEGITEMSIAYTASDSLPYFFETIDCNGNSTTWVFSSFTVHSSLDQTLFDLEIPEGYELLDAGAM
jgi:outer membrane lipoprotein-sorting protein